MTHTEWSVKYLAGSGHSPQPPMDGICISMARVPTHMEYRKGLLECPLTLHNSINQGVECNAPGFNHVQNSWHHDATCSVLYTRFPRMSKAIHLISKYVRLKVSCHWFSLCMYPQLSSVHPWYWMQLYLTVLHLNHIFNYSFPTSTMIVRTGRTRSKVIPVVHFTTQRRQGVPWSTGVVPKISPIQRGALLIILDIWGPSTVVIRKEPVCSLLQPLKEPWTAERSRPLANSYNLSSPNKSDRRPCGGQVMRGEPTQGSVGPGYTDSSGQSQCL